MWNKEVVYQILGPSLVFLSVFKLVKGPPSTKLIVCRKMMAIKLVLETVHSFKLEMQHLSLGLFDA